jgi:hypothetical protein
MMSDLLFIIHSQKVLKAMFKSAAEAAVMVYKQTAFYTILTVIEEGAITS